MMRTGDGPGDGPGDEPGDGPDDGPDDGPGDDTKKTVLPGLWNHTSIVPAAVLNCHILSIRRICLIRISCFIRASCCICISCFIRTSRCICISCYIRASRCICISLFIRASRCIRTLCFIHTIRFISRRNPQSVPSPSTSSPCPPPGRTGYGSDPGCAVPWQS